MLVSPVWVSWYLRQMDMNFDTFAILYGFARIRLNRADDLFVDQVAVSRASAIVQGNDENEYEIGTEKNYPIAIVTAAPSFRIEANIETRVVVEVSNLADVDFLLEQLESENLNGAETMRFYETHLRRDTPLDTHEEDRSNAERAARMIVSGVGNAPPTLTPEQSTLVAQEIVAALADPNQFAYQTRIERVLTWALRDDTQPEWAVYVTKWIVQNVDPAVVDQQSVRTLRERYPGI